MVVGTVKSLKAGSNFTLKKGIFCPDNGEGFSVLHKRLALSRNCAAFDVNLGCSGYVYGFWLSLMIVASDWNKEEVDYFILHQANKFIVQNIERKLKVPLEKAPHNVFERYGNQSSDSIPVTICKNLSSKFLGRFLKVILAGFGTGLSWAACALAIASMSCYPVIVLKE